MKIAKIVLLFFTLVIVSVLYWLFFDRSSILRAERTIRSNHVSYSVDMKYYIDAVVNPNIAEFYLNTDVAKEKLFLRLLNPSKAKIILQEATLLVCYDKSRVDYFSSSHILDQYGLKRLEVVVVPIEEGVSCANPGDEEFIFNDF